ncbi:mannitol-1-phosphate 5-dehydrogenase [Buchnera aphidicola (Macrosiphoniella sanborni)]|uniref:Mannitol-1-phosphate 5-dehydrogenase n=1 Tax=Buchnera aphidicola (Macrosiphoniella sanborni) TaxID=1241865 RepID=A0A4D6YDS0_9GAMM|nr:mannitol-1-phosphate 5-dehydrogenase [Buchnera aphidicola]QCI24068.1 mannitol-1-phosphate 5-dehydrogenase [Buchnera aphidicola (Macrosiphoniella sanborni)]
MKALHFGAGNIGRGFIGKTLSESGFEVIFADLNQDIVNAINNNKEYSVKTVSCNRYKITNIKNITAINVNDLDIFKKISSVDLITTAVGVNALNNLANIIAKGIILKVQNESVIPLNIIACENKIKASSFLKKEVLKILPIRYHNYLSECVGFIDCSIDTIIPLVNYNKCDLFVIAEEFKEWIVNIHQFKGTIPKIIDMQFSDNLNLFIERKLFTLNTGHAIAAYLGLIKKYRTIQEAIKDPKIRIIVQSAMQESGAILIKRYNLNQNDHLDYIKKIFFRFENSILSDCLERIARNPIQKLGKEERLIKPILDSIQYKLPYSHLSKGAAAALHYCNPNDLESIKISSLIKKIGIKKTLIKICSASLNEEGIYSIISSYNTIVKELKEIESYNFI